MIYNSSSATTLLTDITRIVSEDQIMFAMLVVAVATFLVIAAEAIGVRLKDSATKYRVA